MLRTIKPAVVVLGITLLSLLLTCCGNANNNSNKQQPANANAENTALSHDPNKDVAADPNERRSEASPFGPLFSAPLPVETGLQPSVSWFSRLLLIFERLMMAVIFSSILAFRPRRDVPLFRRSLFVSQTQILLAVVAAALMMIVGDNTARAFAIFAAVSLVRFRTNIRDPKEITVLLISLALGLAAGVGRFELGIALCVFALALLWMLEYNESEQIVRSMELSIKTRDTDRTQKQIKKLSKKLKLVSEVRSIDPPADEKDVGTIAYYMNIPLSLTTDDLSERILKKDPNNIEKIQWSKTKSASNIFK